jgi:hypothetical protein
MASVAAAGGALWGGSQLLSSADEAALRPQPVEAAPVARAPRPAPLALPVVPSAADESAAKPAPPLTTPRPVPSTTSLVEEGRLLAKARQLVQSGQGPRALEVLRVSESRYPRAVLAQEREVVTIEALALAGNAASAKQRAQRFLKRYPSSPHAGRLQRFVE